MVTKLLILDTKTFLFDDLTEEVSEIAAREILRFMTEYDIDEEGILNTAIRERIDSLTVTDGSGGTDDNLLYLFFEWLNELREELDELGSFDAEFNFIYNGCRLTKYGTIEFYIVDNDSGKSKAL